MAIELKPIQQKMLALTIRGTVPMVQHAWAEKAKRQMREKHAGKKTKDREIRDPQAEYEEATYRTEDGQYAVPAMAVKSALIAAAHKDIGLEKTLLRKALFIKCTDPSGNLPMECSDPIMREDCVRVGAGSTDLRYRPEFRNWSVALEFEFDAELLQIKDIINLINRAGFGVGIGEMRPEKGGEFGRFEVDETVSIDTDYEAKEAA